MHFCVSIALPSILENKFSFIFGKIGLAIRILRNQLINVNKINFYSGFLLILFLLLFWIDPGPAE